MNQFILFCGKIKHMETSHQYKLIDGTFTGENARHILMELIQNKIKYHQLQIFSIHERFNGDASASEKRIAELKQVAEDLKKVLKQVEDHHQSVEIYCPIEVKIKAIPSNGKIRTLSDSAI